MAEDPVELPRIVETLLGSFPIPERDYEADASRIVVRLTETALGSTADQWLVAPFPDEAEPKSVPAAPPSSPSQPSLAALARSVANKPSRPRATDIARESLSVAAAARSQTELMHERARSSRSSSPSVAPEPPRSRPPSTEPAPSEPNSERKAQSMPDRPLSSFLGGPWFAAGGLGLAAAAALLVWFRSQEQPNSPSATAATGVIAAAASPSLDHPPTSAAEPPATSHDSAQSPPQAVAAAPAAPAPAGIPADRSSPAAAVAVTRAGGAAAAPVGGISQRAPSEHVVLDEKVASAQTKSTAKPAAKAVADSTPSGLQPAAGSMSGGLPDKPSTGAVQAAVGSVMGSARACVVGGKPTPTKVTFGSQGTVTEVQVSGPAAGTPAAACIESALRKARVAPFTSPTFTLMVWVRP